jgi:hypothetical protein
MSVMDGAGQSPSLQGVTRKDNTQVPFFIVDGVSFSLIKTTFYGGPGRRTHASATCEPLV